MDQGNNSRLSFLKAGLVVGGAMYADPASALARSGGQPLGFGPDTFLLPPKTPLSKLIPASQLPGNTGALTLADLSELAELNEGAIRKLVRKFSDVTLGDLGDAYAYAIGVGGSTTPLIQEQSGEIVITCCCCSSCCIKFSF
ncbi:MAG TPA: hypothetical protein VGX91_11785 [Candidatus Cybelea sp.]|jgi:hypothetical protein|nr:hypothetical protein [Candidatus Cybelea sp.]